ncbi:MAG: tetratricopeptide repeat protein [Candidatus Bathyarchaeota archaeon]|nr:tetratricopeptide repeat protein [Candidatus Bathyarchaeota archaeon]
MGKGSKEIEKFLRIAYEGRSDEAEEFIVRKIEQGEVDREEVVPYVLGYSVGGLIHPKEPREQSLTIILNCLRICLKINRKKSLEPFIHNYIGTTMAGLGRLEEAEASFRKAIEIEPESLRALINLGVALWDLERISEAEIFYRKALKVNLDSAVAHENLGELLFETERVDEAKLHLNIAHRNYAGEARTNSVFRVEAFLCWIAGYESWQTGDFTEAENGYVSASKSFRRAGKEKRASILALIPKYFEIDEEYLGYINCGNLIALKNGIQNLSQRLGISLRRIRKHEIPEIEILEARATCIQFLRNSLLFKPASRRKLEKAKQILASHHFLKAYEGANAIDVFNRYLNRFSPHKNLNDITKEQEKELFMKLNAAIGLDGIVTHRFAKVIAESVKQDLRSLVTKPVIEEEMKTRRILEKRIGKIEEELESIHITILGIKQEITIKRIAYGELEIIFPTPLGIYKLHVPMGTITAQDLAKVKMDISNTIDQAIEKAKQTSTELYTTLKSKKQEIMQKILTKLEEMLGKERLNVLSRKLGRGKK